MGRCHTLSSNEFLDVVGAGTSEPRPVCLAVVGSANSGKSVLFNELTGAYSIVANYPQTTVAPICQTITRQGRELRLIDTPGLSSLDVYGKDERSTLELLIRDRPSGVIFCGDALRLKRSLALLGQMMELEIPIICCLNKADEASANGMAIDADHLTQALGIPVVEISAIHGFGLDRLWAVMDEFMADPDPTPRAKPPVVYPAFVEEAVERVRGFFPLEKRPSRGEALLFLQGNETVSRWFAERLGEGVLQEAAKVLAEERRNAPERIRMTLFQARDDWGDRLVERALRQATFLATSLAQRAAWASRHPILGWPIFFGILWLTFQGVGLGAADVGGWLDETLFKPANEAIGAWIPYPWLSEFLVGQFGILTMGVSNALVTVVPILVIFFLIVNVLEDVGYLPNLSVLANRALTPLGLTGKAVLPLVLGTGCNTTATMTSRILETKKERLLLSFLVALGVPCSVQMGVLMAILATMPFTALLIVLGAVAITTVSCALLMNRLVPHGGESADFIMELPSLHLPNWRNIVVKTYYRIKWFLLEALPMFVAAAMLMFTLQKTGLLNGIKTLLHPLVTGVLDMPDKVTEVFILVLSRREVGAVYFKQMVEGAELDYVQIVTGLVVITLFIPCVSNTMVMIKEFGARWAVATNLGIVAIAIGVGGVVNHLMRLV
ncbi:MAG: ferrous iron transport protein B [Magnetococcales bacterium]|nr:ferrous iron transport protein B [Magnetococcales bacterium]